MDEVGKSLELSFPSKKTTSIFFSNPMGGSQSAPVLNIRISSRLHVQSPAKVVTYKVTLFSTH